MSSVTPLSLDEHEQDTRAYISVSLDGYMAGTNETMEEPAYRTGLLGRERTFVRMRLVYSPQYRSVRKSLDYLIEDVWIRYRRLNDDAVELERVIDLRQPSWFRTPSCANTPYRDP